MATLPEPTGPYSVSTLTIEVPVGQPRTFLPDRYLHKAKAARDDRPAFQLRTVAVTFYYPTESVPHAHAHAHAHGRGARGAGQTWLPAPRLKSLTGLLKYAGVSGWWAFPVLVPAWWLGLWGARLPTSRAQPLASHLDAAGNIRNKWPTAVFSPGLAGTATTYSVYCSRIASHGVVVAALDHRDGTSPSSVVHLPAPPESPRKHPLTEEIVYTREEEVTAGSDKTEEEKQQDKWHFRRTQLAFRRAELHEAVRLLVRINAGEGKAVIQASTRQVTEQDKEAYFGTAKLAEWAHRLELGSDEQTALIGLGHSFGAATLLSCIDGDLAPLPDLAEGTSKAVGSAGPKFQRVVLLDPWTEPLVVPATGPPPADTPPVPPFHAIVSQGFAVWSSHFKALQGIATSLFHRQQRDGTGGRDRESWLATLSGSRHTDFSDFPWIIPRFFARHLAKTSHTVTDFMDVFETLTLRAILGTEEAAEGDDETARSVALRRSKFEGIEARWERPGELNSKDLGPFGVLIRHPLPTGDQSAGTHVDASRGL
ncbi:unnamed protein product [Parajaminaea phylloscopi]